MITITERAHPGATSSQSHSLDATSGPRDTAPRAQIGGDDGVAVVVPVSGRISLVTMSPDVLALARREIGATTVDRLRLGPVLIPTGAQMWIDAHSLLTNQPLNPRARALVRASCKSRLLRLPVAGTAMFTGPDDPRQRTLGLNSADALLLLLRAARATRKRAARATNRTRRGPLMTTPTTEPTPHSTGPPQGTPAEHRSAHIPPHHPHPGQRCEGTPGCDRRTAGRGVLAGSGAVMGHRRAADAVKRARFLVSELTGSRIEHEERQRAQRLRERMQRLRDVGWDERADEIEQQSEQGWQL